MQSPGITETLQLDCVLLHSQAALERPTWYHIRYMCCNLLRWL